MSSQWRHRNRRHEFESHQCVKISGKTLQWCYLQLFFPFYIYNKIQPYTPAGFDNTIHYSAGGDDTTRPRCQCFSTITNFALCVCLTEIYIKA
jgi:hypothetical protein